MKNMKDREKPLILIVDDNQHNLQMLGNMLKQCGYSLALASNGMLALEFAKNNLPDLILLDLMMPDMDGFEVCKRLKQDIALADIPVIFLTAKSEKEDIIEGLELGAVDYVTKPFDIKELVTRLNTHLELKAAKEGLRQKMEELKQANAIKDKIFSIITHDLRELFAALLGFSEELWFNKNIDADGKEDVKVIQQTSKQGYNLLKNLLEWSHLQTGKTVFQPTQLKLKNIVVGQIELFSNDANYKNITICSDIVETTSVFADENMLSTIIRNLLSNAVKFTQANGTVEVSARQEDNEVEISIADTGVGIKSEDMDKLFRLEVTHISTSTGKKKGTGLGLILCKEFVEKNAGIIRVESEEGNGSIFYIRLPAQEKKKVDF